MSSESGYLQLKIRENSEEINSLKLEASNLKLKVENSDRLLDSKINEFNKIKEEVGGFDIPKMKEKVLEEVFEKVRKDLISDFKKNKEKQKEILIGWHGDISKDIKKQGIDIEDGTLNIFRELVEVLFNVFESNQIIINENHKFAIRSLTNSSEEMKGMQKNLRRQKNKPITKEGYKRLEKGLPKSVDVYGIKKKLEEEQKERIKEVNEIFFKKI